MPRKKPKTTEAIAIIHRRHYPHRPEREASLQEERVNAEIARRTYDLRKAAGLSQRALAELVGTTASVICRLEDADYEGHSLAMLQRIAAALNTRGEIRFVARQPALRTVRDHPAPRRVSLGPSGPPMRSILRPGLAKAQ